VTRPVNGLLVTAALCAGLAACSERNADLTSAARGTDANAEAIYTNGRVYTVDRENTWAEAFAIRDGEFVAVGSNAEIEQLAGPDTTVLDLRGRMVMPGIHDLHMHPMVAGEKEKFQCSFPFGASLEEILALVADCAAATPRGEWLRGGQWPTELLESETLPHKNMLDAITTEHPVYLGDSAVHGAWLNSKGLEALGVDHETPNPKGGVIMRDAAGDATGILLDNAAYDAVRSLPSYTPQQGQGALAWAIEQANQVGVTTLKDAIVDSHAAKAYKALADAGELNVRAAISFAWKASWTETHEAELYNIDNRPAYAADRVDPNFVKIFLDGIPPSMTAAMFDPYESDGRHPPGYAGQLIHSPEDLRNDVVALDRVGLTVKIHATGDRSAQVALDAFEAARKANGASDRIHEVSHAELLHPDDIPRFAELNVAAEMCPILWYPSPLVAAMQKVLGAERGQKLWPVKALLESGALVIYGSDWPSVVPDPNPWPGVEAMVTRRDPYGVHAGSLWLEQAIDLAAALRIVTHNGAIAARRGDRSGSIEVGKDADFVVLDRNLFEVPIEAVSDTEVLRTVVGGTTVYERGVE